MRQDIKPRSSYYYFFPFFFLFNLNFNWTGGPYYKYFKEMSFHIKVKMVNRRDSESIRTPYLSPFEKQNWKNKIFGHSYRGLSVDFKQ